jgi:hypothetical protein
MKTVLIYVSRNISTKKPYTREDYLLDGGANERPDIEVEVQIDDSLPSEPYPVKATVIEDVRNMDKDGNDLEGFMFLAGEEIELSKSEEEGALEKYDEDRCCEARDSIS